MEFFFSFRSLLPLFSNGLWWLHLSFLYASFTKSICIDLAKAVAGGTGGPYEQGAPVLMLVKATGGLESESLQLQICLICSNQLINGLTSFQKCPAPKSHIKNKVSLFCDISVS